MARHIPGALRDDPATHQNKRRCLFTSREQQWREASRRILQGVHQISPSKKRSASNTGRAKVGKSLQQRYSGKSSCSLPFSLGQCWRTQTRSQALLVLEDSDTQPAAAGGGGGGEGQLEQDLPVAGEVIIVAGQSWIYCIILLYLCMLGSFHMQNIMK